MYNSRTNHCDNDDSEEDSSEAAQTAVASAEEYAAKIIKLQQACLIPLKEDLADWLNKILKTSQITTGNFMDKLDNGVIVCRLAKVISVWCKQQLGPQENDFLDNLIWMHNAKIWEDARCRTFYARDNVSNFIKWCTNFGINRSVIFESDDLVLHANPRQVVLCLLDVARIAYVRYGFTEAPGLVKFEQEIERQEIIASGHDIYNGFSKRESATLVHGSQYSATGDNKHNDLNGWNLNGRALPSSDDNHTRESFGDATDELVIRYCRHKEREAARKRQLEELEEINQLKQSQVEDISDSLNVIEDTKTNEGKHVHEEAKEAENGIFEPDSLLPDNDRSEVTSSTDVEKLCDNNCSDKIARISSLDSGEGPTESSSTIHNTSQVNDNNIAAERAVNEVQMSAQNEMAKDEDSISPTPISNPITATTTATSNSVTENSELSSSRSSLLSNQDCNDSTSNYGRHITSDLDVKVMRIAKSYYGKKATKDVTRLSEGKYKIADRIVFVRLLKGHRVMVRIGGGWDTLENFLFRHKSDPSQVIDPDNLLPLETKMSLEKSAQLGTPKGGTPLRSPGGNSKMPNYRRSNSASSTNLSLSNLSFSNLSLASSQHNTPSRLFQQTRGVGNGLLNSSYNSTSAVNQSPKRQIPRLLIHKGQLVNRTPRHALNTAKITSDGSAIKQQREAAYTDSIVGRDIDNFKSPERNAQVTSSGLVSSSTGKSPVIRGQMYLNSRVPSHQRLTSTTPLRQPHHQGGVRSIQIQRPLASTKAPTYSATNLYPATLIANTARWKNDG